MFELGKDLFDRIEVRAVRRQEEEPGASGTDGAAYRLALVAAEIIEDDDITWLQRGDEHLLDVDAERLAVDWAIENPRSLNAIMAQGGKKGHRLPMTVGRLGLEPLAAQTPAAQRCHIGLGPRLIDEDKTSGINLILIFLPARPAPGDVGAILLAWQHAFF